VLCFLLLLVLPPSVYAAPEPIPISAPEEAPQLVPPAPPSQTPAPTTAEPLHELQLAPAQAKHGPLHTAAASAPQPQGKMTTQSPASRLFWGPEYYSPHRTTSPYGPEGSAPPDLKVPRTRRVRTGSLLQSTPASAADLGYALSVSQEIVPAGSNTNVTFHLTQNGSDVPGAYIELGGWHGATTADIRATPSLRWLPPRGRRSFRST
jgi:hypothetical protein